VPPLFFFSQPASSPLGKGEFGVVYVGSLRKENSEDFMPVAIKVAQKHLLPSLLREIKILSYIGVHPNIVSMVGASVKDLQQSTMPFVAGRL
jgi:serine/threonine protein kinase